MDPASGAQAGETRRLEHAEGFETTEHSEGTQKVRQDRKQGRAQCQAALTDRRDFCRAELVDTRGRDSIPALQTRKLDFARGVSRHG
jgi:hypothetical protein